MKQTRVSVQLKWLHQAQFAGYYAAADLGFYDDEGLLVEIRPGGPGADPERLVASGHAHFAQGGGVESLLAGRADGLPIVAIGAVFQKIDVVFIARKESGIVALSDVSSHTVSTWHTGVHLILRGLLMEAGLPPGSVVEVAQANSMEPFLRGEVTLAAATLFNQLPRLYAEGIAVTVFDPAELGLVFPRDTVITSEAVLERQPDIAVRFLRASLRGWRYVIERPDEGVDAVLRRDPMLDRAHQAAMMQEVARLMTWGPGTSAGIGYIEPMAVECAHAFLLRNRQIARSVALETAFNLDCWRAAESLT